MSLPKLNTPTFELKLPSSGESVRYRPFLVREHKILMTMAEADNQEVGRIVSELVDVCTFNKLNVNKLPHFDIEYIFMNLRAKSIGEKVDVVVNCDCGNKIETEFSIDNLAVEKKPDHSNKIMLTDDLGVEMMYPRFSDVMDVFQSKNSEVIFDLIAKNIKGIFDKDSYWEAAEQSPDEVKEFLFSLTRQQFDKIEEFFVTSPKIVQTVECVCDKCGKHNVNKIEGLQNFFV